MADDQQQQQQQGVNKEEFDKLVASVSTLAGTVGEMQKGFNTSIGQLTESLKGLGQGKGGNGEDDDDGNNGTDLESLSRGDFAKFIVGNITKQLEEPFKKLNERIDGVDTRHSSRFLSDDVKRFAGEHKDFWDWKPEIEKLASETPGLSFSRAYNIARNENPDKAKELDQKYAEPKDPNESKGFGGLTPTSGVATKSQQMNQADAGEAAWNDTMQGVEAALNQD